MPCFGTGRAPATNASYDGSAATGASTSFGFQGTWSTSDPVPASLTCTPSSTVTPAIVTNATSAPVMQGFRCAAAAAGELWPLITRPEARIAAGHAAPEAMRLLAQARMATSLLRSLP